MISRVTGIKVYGKTRGSSKVGYIIHVYSNSYYFSRKLKFQGAFALVSMTAK